jgi:hypothetical protein
MLIGVIFLYHPSIVADAVGVGRIPGQPQHSNVGEGKTAKDNQVRRLHLLSSVLVDVGDARREAIS